jgi:CheY-specific phosphatase CheX/3-deoxy-D-manno-octulosonate 8-phosphate phosphatase KdsC-like HAD superfamily phosphatase
MAIKFFGQFLIDQGAITHSVLLKALNLQEKTNRKLGDIVFDMKLMSRVDIARVQQAQRHEDVMFGDKAVEMGFLTPQQLEQALALQRDNHLYIGEALVKLGALSHSELNDYLKKFHQEQKPFLVEKVSIPAAVAHQPVWEIVADLTYKMLSRIAGLSFRPGACEVIERLPQRTMIAEMGFSGSASARYLLSVSPRTRKIFARAILPNTDLETESTEILDDSVMEFINIICGNIAAKASLQGFQLDLGSPKISSGINADRHVPEDHTGLMFPIYLNDGEVFELAVFVSNKQPT